MTSTTLAGRGFIVTGAASGIGLATATRLLAEGARVVLVDVDDDALALATQELGSDTAVALRADVANEAEVEHAFACAVESLGRVDGLHNNAGIGGGASVLADATYEDFDRLVRVNLRGAFLPLRWMLRFFRDEAIPGAIVNTSSSLALRGAPRLGVYNATKAAVASLTLTAAIEAAPAVRVNAVLPGPIATPMTAAAFSRNREAITARVPQGRTGTPAEVAALVVWLLGDESSYVNGALYTIDGGEAAGFA